MATLPAMKAHFLIVLAFTVVELIMPAERRQSHLERLSHATYNVSYFVLSPFAMILPGALVVAFTRRFGPGLIHLDLDGLTAGIGMLIALVIYLAGRRNLPPDPLVRRNPDAPKPKLQPGEGRTVALLVLLLPVLSASVLCNQEIFNAYLVWADSSVNLSLLGYRLPTTWLITLDSVVSVTFLAGMVVFWRVWAKRFKEPDELGKLAIGTCISVLGVLCLVAGSAIGFVVVQ